MGDYKSPIKSTARRRVPSRFAVGGTVVWFYGATIASGQNSGAGGVLWIHQHIIFKWTINFGSGTKTTVELLGAWALLTLASQFAILELFVQGDSKIVIDWLQGKGRL